MSTKRGQSSNNKGEASKRIRNDTKAIDINQSALGRKRKLNEVTSAPVEASKQQLRNSTNGKSKVEAVHSQFNNDPSPSNKRARREKQHVIVRDKTGDQVVKGKEQVKEVLGKKSSQAQAKKSNQKKQSAKIVKATKAETKGKK
jgi:hypothetical protein